MSLLAINLTIMSIMGVMGIFIQSCFIFIENKKEYGKAVILKGLASLVFFFVGLVGFIISTKNNICIFILIGLILGVIGDICLNLRFVLKKGQLVFILGTLSFLLGHIFYIVALMNVVSDKSFIYIPILIAIAVTLIVAIFIFTKLKVRVGMKIFGCIYILIVSLFMATANYNLVNIQNKFTILSSIGSILFFSSDVILIFNSFGPNPRLSLRASNLLLYYVGQLLIGFSLLFI